MSEYELILMLDPEVEEDARDTLADSAKQRIEGKGEVRHADTWGMRKMAYKIEKRIEADYRFFRFTGGNDLLDELDHNLKIADGVLRFRIFKVDPRSPITGAPEVWTPPARRDEGGRGPRRDRDEDSYDDRDSQDSAPRRESAPAPAAVATEAAPAAAAEPAEAPAPAADAAPADSDA